jgi:hypothetical protein
MISERKKLNVDENNHGYFFVFVGVSSSLDEDDSLSLAGFAEPVVFFAARLTVADFPRGFLTLTSFVLAEDDDEDRGDFGFGFGLFDEAQATNSLTYFCFSS